MDFQDLGQKANTRFRRRLFAALTTWLGGILAIISINTLSLLLRGQGLSGTAFTPLALIWLGGSYWTGVRLKVWRCPLCGGRWNIFNPYARWCANCGLRR
jgi:hypothetical protein